jgi:histidinol-phosphatase (PHP family)
LIAHLDLIKKFNAHNRFYHEDDGWYQALIDDTLRLMDANGCMLEINTKAIQSGCCDYFYPSKFILQRCLDLNIPLVLNSDAHHPDQLEFYFKEAARLLIELGVGELFTLKGNRWISNSFNELGYNT